MYGLERKRLGDILVEAGLLTDEQLGEALAEQKESGAKLGKVLVGKGILTEYDILGALAHQTDIPLIALKETIIDPEVVTLLPERISRKHGMLAIEKKHGAIVIACSDPFNVQGIDEARLALGSDVDLVLTPGDEIAGALDEHFAPSTSLEGILGGATADDIEVMKEEADLTKKGDADDSQIVKVVNALILEAVKNRASDIHIEPFEHEFQVRQRLDGVLHKMPAPPRALQNAVTSRIKVMANLNISEQRLPQDGRLRIKLGGKEIDLRVSTLPTVFGESVVMRILDRGATVLGLEQLGMADAVRIKAEKVIENPNGIVVVTGPTGCGKTSTLYACIEKLNDPNDKVITVEDPVEYEVDGLVQVPVNEKVGMTFAAALRSILRQDPDVVIIGEMRDVETAEISVQASLTGHLVLSTLHTNQAAGALTRMIDMGIEPFLLSSTILGICGQRLVRVVCPMCKEPYQPSEAALLQVTPPGETAEGASFMKGRGCPDCANTGFRGRTGIYELLVVTPDIEELILEKAAANLIHRRAVELGMQSMAVDGWCKAKAGITTIEEVLRVAPMEAKGHKKKEVEVD